MRVRFSSLANGQIDLGFLVRNNSLKTNDDCDTYNFVDQMNNEFIRDIETFFFISLTKVEPLRASAPFINIL